jgi:hypothetical protein
MRKDLKRVACISFLAVFIPSCTTSHDTRTYADPSLGTKIISSMAVLPVRNAPIAQSESIRMNRELAQTVQRKNPALRVLGPVEAVEKLNELHLVDDYDRYLAGLAQSGIPNREILLRIGEALGVDALMQGQIIGLMQQDSAIGRPASTAFALRYSIVSTKDGMLLWETSEEMRKKRQTIFSSAPPLQEVLPEAVAKVIQSIPSFAFANRKAE